MDRVILSLRKRFVIPAVFSVAFAVWIFLCQAYHDSYWEGTIYRVQTVDFNILHHTLPATLSQLIAAGRDDLIQQVLDSTYGIFGLVVTNPTGDTILYQTSKIYRRKTWQKMVSPEYLSKLPEPYDVLTDPAPLGPQYEHASPRAAIARAVDERLPGRVLGRVYYVRQIPPTLTEDLGGFLGGPWELSGAKRCYLYISLSMLGFSFTVLLLIWLRKRELELKQQRLAHSERELEIKKKALEHLTAELATQQSRKEWLEREADMAYRRAASLKDAMHQLQASLKADGAPTCVEDSQPSPIKLRPPVHPPSAMMQEVEQYIPELINEANNLRQQAAQLHQYCAQLEARQTEMKRILDQAYLRAAAQTVNNVHFGAQ